MSVFIQPLAITNNRAATRNIEEFPQFKYMKQRHTGTIEIVQVCIALKKINIHNVYNYKTFL